MLVYDPQNKTYDMCNTQAGQDKSNCCEGFAVI